MHNPQKHHGCALLLLACALITPGCETKTGSPGVSPSTSLTRQSAAAVSLSHPTVEDLLRPADSAQQDILDRLFVPLQAAERYAHGFVLNRGYLSKPITTCLAIPSEDGAGSLLAWHFILAHEASCLPFGALLKQARDLWNQADGPPVEAAVLKLKRAIEASAKHFYSIEVAAYTFHHPLREGQRGLPSWIFSAANGDLPLGDAECAPGAALPPGQGHHYLLRYTCGSSELIYSHTKRQVLAPQQVAVAAAPGANFARWQQTIRSKYGAELPGYLAQHQLLWEKYLLGAGQSSPTEEEDRR